MIGLFLTIFRNSLPKKFLQINNSTENLCSILASNFNKSWSIRNVSWMKKINGTANQKLDKVVEEPTSKIEVSSKSIEIAVDPFVPLKTAYRYFYTEPEKIYNFQKCVQSIRNFHDSSTEPQILTVPEFPDGSAKGDLKIQKKENDKVNAHEVLFKIETERSYVYVTAPTDGVLIQNLLPDGAKVIPGQELAKFGQNTPIATEQKKIISSLKPLNLTNQKNVFEKGPSNLKQDSPMELLESSPKSTWGTSTSHTDKIMKDKTSTSSTQIASTKSNSGTEEIREHKIFLPKNFNALKGAEEQIMKVPKYPDGSTTGKIKWFKRKYGQVDENELLFKIETNKTFIYIAAPNMGTVTEVFVKDGQNVETGQKLFKIKNKPTKGNLRTLPYYTTSKFKDLPAPAKSPKQIKEPLIKQKGIPFQFRIAPMTIIPPKARPRPKKATVTETRKEYRVKMSNTRQQIANRLKKTQNTKAMLTTFNEIDMSDIIKYRNNNLEKFKQIYGFNFSYISVFCKAVANAIRDQPIINAVIDSNDIVYRDFVDISIAIATKIELLEPIIKNVDKMNFMDIEKTIQEMVYKARTGILAIKDEEGGTFTISNGGVFGSLLGTPIINPSQSSILGMHSIINRPIAFDGEIKIRPMMYVALTYDNRLINGQEAVNFLKKIKNYVEEPSIILKDVKLSQ